MNCDEDESSCNEEFFVKVAILMKANQIIIKSPLQKFLKNNINKVEQ